MTFAENDKTRREDDNRQHLTQEEVEQTFARLGLNDPRVRQFYLQLTAWEEKQTDQVVDWYGTHSGTNF